jgi:hypothetical protein
MSEKPPTRIRIYYPDTAIGLWCSALLCQLGYTVIVDRFFKDHPTLSQFYHVKVDLNGSQDYDYVFDIDEHKNTLYISQRREARIWEYIKCPSISFCEFAGFCIYHWGLSRGGRPLYESPVLVDRAKIDKWWIIPLIEERAN